MSADLGQQALSLVLRGLAEEYSTKTKAAPNRFFEDSSTLDGAIAIRSEFAMREDFSKLFDQSIVPSLDAP
jgi:hypothetical protein